MSLIFCLGVPFIEFLNNKPSFNWANFVYKTSHRF